MDKRIIRPIDLIITSGTSVTIVIPPQFLVNGKHFNLDFRLSEPDRVKFRDLIEGTEQVFIQNGVGGTSYILEDNNADVFYSDLLRLGFCYILRWGNNGAAATGGGGGVQHFLNLNTPCCARRYNPANNTIPPSTDPPIAPTITTTTLSAITAGTAFSEQLGATGAAPITYAVTAGTLPAGLTLSPTGLLSGTPTGTSGTAYNFTVTATNAAGTSTPVDYSGTLA
ncbi:MAG: Ig domain-containing protein [Oscillospiraceae bacterium]|nr:Ig domain-containing protein [Oscillospiraceae bacterium]